MLAWHAIVVHLDVSACVRHMTNMNDASVLKSNNPRIRRVTTDDNGLFHVEDEPFGILPAQISIIKQSITKDLTGNVTVVRQDAETDQPPSGTIRITTYVLDATGRDQSWVHVEFKARRIPRCEARLFDQPRDPSFAHSAI